MHASCLNEALDEAVLMGSDLFISLIFSTKKIKEIDLLEAVFVERIFDKRFFLLSFVEEIVREIDFPTFK